MENNIQSKELGRKVGSWVWCLHCERCYQVGEFKMDESDGDTILDSWTWEEIKELHPEYPDVPEKNKVYPLYE